MLIYTYEMSVSNSIVGAITFSFGNALNSSNFRLTISVGTSELPAIIICGRCYYIFAIYLFSSYSSSTIGSCSHSVVRKLNNISNLS